MKAAQRVAERVAAQGAAGETAMTSCSSRDIHGHESTMPIMRFEVWRGMVLFETRIAQTLRDRPVPEAPLSDR